MSKKIDEEERLEIYSPDDSLAKANLLINSKYKSTLNCQKIMYAGLLKVQEKQYRVDEDTKEFVVEMPASEIVRVLGLKKGSSIYKSLEPIARSMFNTPMGVTDAETESFEYIALITAAKYSGGVFSMSFNPKLGNLLLNLKQNFTRLSRSIMMSWHTIYAYRMYELLRQQAYYPKNYSGVKNGVFQVTYDVYELRLLLGVVNSNLDSVQKILNGTNPPDYKKACEASPEKLYEEWRDFRKYVIMSAINEINKNELSDIKIEFKPLKKAQNQVYAIEFTIYLKEIYDNREKDSNIPDIPSTVKDGVITKNISQEDKFVIQYEVCKMLEKFSVPISDVYTISEAVDYDLELLKAIIERLEKQKNKIENVTGWIITAARNDNYNNNSSYTPGNSNAKKSSFVNIEEQDYNFDELEKAGRKKMPK